LKPTVSDAEEDADPDVDVGTYSDDESEEEEEEDEEVEFTAEQCLFCNDLSDSFYDNVIHMQKSHGLFIQDIDHLIVDLETLVRYLHLVVFGYRECLFCHSQRRTPEAAQQHMIGKRHCKIDIHDPESEYRDFFDFTTNTTADESGSDEDDDGDDENESDTRKSRRRLSPPTLGGESTRLPSGRIVSNRTSIQTPLNRQQNTSRSPLRPTSSTVVSRAALRVRIPGAPGRGPAAAATASALSSSSSPLDPASSQVTTRKERRGVALMGQIARLSKRDQLSLAHLPVSQQRAILNVQKKQMDSAIRAEIRYRLNVQLKANNR